VDRLGTPFQTLFGRVGTNHQVERTIEQN
jgi:hypothetical protein